MLGTSSSESVLPRMMAKMENLGATKSAVGLVIPTGYSFNLDGTSIYLTMAAVFIAQATNTPMTLDAAAHAAGGAAADVEGRGGRHRQRLHRAGGDAVGGRARAGRRARADPRHRPLHVGGARADEPDRQRRRDGGRRASGRGELDEARMQRVLEQRDATSRPRSPRRCSTRPERTCRSSAGVDLTQPLIAGTACA